jgi:hypothetical protein
VGPSDGGDEGVFFTSKMTMTTATIRHAPATTNPTHHGTGDFVFVGLVPVREVFEIMVCFSKTTKFI